MLPNSLSTAKTHKTKQTRWPIVADFAKTLGCNTSLYILSVRAVFFPYSYHPSTIINFCFLTLKLTASSSNKYCPQTEMTEGQKKVGTNLSTIAACWLVEHFQEVVVSLNHLCCVRLVFQSAVLRQKTPISYCEI